RPRTGPAAPGTGTRSALRLYLIVSAARPAGSGPVLEGESRPDGPVDPRVVEVPAPAAARAPYRVAQPALQGVVVRPRRRRPGLDRARLLAGQQAQAAQHVLGLSLDHENDRGVAE